MMINSTGPTLTAQKIHYFGRACVNAEDHTTNRGRARSYFLVSLINSEHRFGFPFKF